MNAAPVWHGTQQEAGELVGAINRVCACEYGAGNVVLRRCAAHSLLLDQAALDRLLFLRRIRTRLLAGEYQEGAGGADAA